MPEVRGALRDGAGRAGGVLGYPLDSLYQEVAFVAFHFHWPLAAVMGLEHEERRRWVREISALNERMNGD